MKRICLLSIIIAAFMLSCSKPTLEDRAKKRIKPATELIVNDPNSLIIQDVKTIIANDSLCVLHFLAKEKNEYGEYETNTMEYYLVREIIPSDNDVCGWNECVYQIDNKEDELIYKARNIIRNLEDSGVDVQIMPEESAMYLLANTIHLFDGRLHKVE